MTQCKICNKAKLTQCSGHYYDYLSQQRFEIWNCKYCNSKQTMGNLQGNHYGQAYYGSAKGKFSSILETIFLFNHKRNARHFYKKFKPETAVEIGCGRGYMLAALQTLGCNVTGIESAGAESWILNNPAFPVLGISDEQTWPIENNSIDLVIIWHVLEHVSDPATVLSEINRILTPDGAVCISVPNCESLQAKLQLPQWFHLDVPRHLFHFSRAGLSQLLSQQGYAITEEKNGDILQNTYGWWQTLANIITPDNNNMLYRFLQGGTAWKGCPKKPQIIWHLLALPIIIPLGFTAMLIENLFGKPGTITIYAKKFETGSTKASSANQ